MAAPKGTPQTPNDPARSGVVKCIHELGDMHEARPSGFYQMDTLKEGKTPKPLLGK